MSRSTAVMTIASANYLPYVKTLMQSVKETNSDYKRYFVIVDKCPSDQILCGDLFEVLESDDIGIDQFEDMSVRYDVMEMNTAVKPFAIEWLFNNTDANAVIYLDPDIQVYRKLTELQTLLKNGASVVLTPHLTAPVEDGKQPNDYHMLQAGVFNLGFIAVNRVAEAREFVRWWARRLMTQGHADMSRNLFTDQRWLDLAPCFLNDLVVFKDPAYNVAYWNLVHRPVKNRGGKYYIGNRELAFFHFSGIEREKPTLVSKHQDRLTWNDIKPLHKLFNDYRCKMLENGWAKPDSSRYHYDYAGDLKISPIVRALYREIYDEPLIGVPIDQQFLIAMCNQSAGIAHDRSGRVTRLLHKIYRSRPDLQAAFNLSKPEGIAGLVYWFEHSAEDEYGIDPRLTRPSAADRKHAAGVSLPGMERFRPNAGKPWYFRQWRKARRWVVERI